MQIDSLVNRAHIVTTYHKKLAKRLREIREDTIWIDGEDVCMAFKPQKMGLRMAHLHETWEQFVEKYMRILSTYRELYKIEVTEDEVKADLEFLRELHSELKERHIIQDTVNLLHEKIHKGKRILVEDCSSSSMDVDHGNHFKILTY